jgi:hypothetical protein
MRGVVIPLLSTGRRLVMRRRLHVGYIVSFAAGLFIGVALAMLVR